MLRFYLVAIMPSSGLPQLSRNSQEVLASLDAYLHPDQNWKLNGTASAIKSNESFNANGAIGLFADYFSFPQGFVQKWAPQGKDSLPGKFFWLRLGYQNTASPPSSKDPFKKNMLVTEANSGLFFPWKMLLKARNHFDWLTKNGEFFTRYSPKLQLERDIRTEYLTFTASEFVVYFANFGNALPDKLRTQLGVEIWVSKQMNCEDFWNRKYVRAPEVQEVYAFGMTNKLCIEKKDFIKPLFSKKEKNQSLLNKNGIHTSRGTRLNGVAGTHHH